MKRSGSLEAAPRSAPIRWAPVLLAVLLLLPALAVALSAVPRSGLAAAVGLGVVALDHPTRVKILSHLEAVPGDHFRSIVRSIQSSIGETRHHLNVLMRRGHVREDRAEGRCRYYLQADEAVDRNALFEQYWRLSDHRVRVLNVVRERQIVGPSVVATDLGISRQLASYHLLRLTESGEIQHRGDRYQAWSGTIPPAPKSYTSALRSNVELPRPSSDRLIRFRSA